MSRRWAPPKPASPQASFALPARGRFTPAVKSTTDTSVASAASLGLTRGGDSATQHIGDLAAAMLGVIERRTSKTRLDGVMLAVEIRAQVYAYLVAHPTGATADEIAAAINYSILTVRPRVSELRRQGRILDSGVRRKNISGKSAIVWKIGNNSG
jgi:hypothetical protein